MHFLLIVPSLLTNDDNMFFKLGKKKRKHVHACKGDMILT